MQKSESQLKLQLWRAKHENNITLLINPHFSFRLYVNFKKPYVFTDGPRKGEKVFKIWRFGFENICSYAQCVQGHFKEIKLNKKQGWDHCVEMAEETYRGRYTRAQIFTRAETPGGSFDILLKDYDQYGKIVNDDGGRDRLINELIAPDQNKTLNFYIGVGELIVLTDNSNPSQLEFSQLVTKGLGGK